MTVFYAKYENGRLGPYKPEPRFGAEWIVEETSFPSWLYEATPVPTEDHAPVCGDCEQGPGKCVCP